MARAPDDKFRLTSSSAGADEEEEDWGAWIGGVAAYERPPEPLPAATPDLHGRISPAVAARLDALARKIDASGAPRRRVALAILLLGVLSAVLQGANFVYFRYSVRTCAP